VRAAFDTNVGLRALFRRTSVARRIVEALAAGRFTLVTSSEILLELEEVVDRPKVRR
jgi:predicted nucleic acid-binding protein